MLQTLITLPEPVAVAHTRPDEMEWHMTKMRFATVESAELANNMLIGAGYNCALRQSRSFRGNNPFTRTVSALPRAIDAAEGTEAFAQLLIKQFKEECNPDVTVAVRSASSAAPLKFVLKFSTLGEVEQARGKFSVFQDMDKLCNIQISEQPLITRVGQIAIETDGPAGSGSVDLDLAAVLAAVKAYALPRKGRAEA
jgi:hypothetical protein